MMAVREVLGTITTGSRTVTHESAGLKPCPTQIQQG